MYNNRQNAENCNAGFYMRNFADKNICIKIQKEPANFTVPQNT